MNIHDNCPWLPNKDQVSNKIILAELTLRQEEKIHMVLNVKLKFYLQTCTLPECKYFSMMAHYAMRQMGSKLDILV